MDIKQSMTDLLRSRGLDTEPFLSIVSDYVVLYDVCEQLKERIRNDGVLIKGVNGTKINPAVRELRSTNGAMLKMLKQLGIAAAAQELYDMNDEL